MGRQKSGRRAPAVPASANRARGLPIVGALVVAAVAWALYARRPAPPNLLLVTIDTLRADRLGCYGHAQAETPVLDALAARGARFENAVASVPLTGPSHATILTGLYPPMHGVRDNVVFSLEPRHATLATRLRGRGFRTAAFVAAYPVAAAFGFRQGFDEFAEDFHEAAAAGQGAERPANEVADAGIAWLSRLPSRQPFFLWLHFYDPHAPYTPPAPYAERFRARPYDGEIAFVDAQLGRVLDALRAAGRADSSFVAVLADHGEALGEHGERTHAVLVYQATLRIPLILAGPRIAPGRVVRERVATVDVVPTLLGLLGQGLPEGLPGRDLGPALRGERLSAQPLYAESLFGRLNCRWATLRGLIREDWKLIQGAEPELYNIAEDPQELTNRAGSDPERLRSLQAELVAAVGKMVPGGDHARSRPATPEQEERLRSLGYAAGSPGSGDMDEPGLPDPRTRVALYERLQALLANPALAPQTVDEAERLAAQDAGNPFAQFALASLAFQAGRFGRAERAFARALELDPERPSIRLAYARLLREMGRLDDSERQHRIALEQSAPEDVRVRLSLAETLIKLGRLGEALALIDAVLAREPRQLEALATKARLLVARGEARAAVPLLEQANASGDADVAIELGSTYLRLGDGAAAARAVAPVLRASPGHPWALAVAGHGLILGGAKSDGVALLGQALAARPRRPAAWLALAAAFDAAGDAQRASRCRREATAASLGS